MQARDAKAALCTSTKSKTQRPRYQPTITTISLRPVVHYKPSQAGSMLPTRLVSKFVCGRCTRRGYRKYSSSSLPDTFEQQAVPFGKVHLSNRRLLLVSGVDASKFLQGLTTNNVDPSRAEGWYTAFLHAQGRVLYEGFIYPLLRNKSVRTRLDGSVGSHMSKGREDDDDWACLIDVDASEVDTLTKHLKRHKLRSKVNLRKIDEGEWDIWAISEPIDGHTTDSICLEDPRAPFLGYRMISPAALSETMMRSDSIHPINDYHHHRYLLGVPEGPQEIVRGQALPMESNIDLMRGIDFKKGCYVGQELTIRTAHTGIVRKRILPVQLYSAVTPPPSGLDTANSSSTPIPPLGTEISAVPSATHSGESDTAMVRRRGRTRAAGTFLTGLGSVGLALCRLEMMTDVRLTAESGGFTPDLEFEMKWAISSGMQADVRAKAFVPQWHKDRERIKPQRRLTSPAA